MTSEREDMLLRRQKSLADFGDFALQSEDLDEILTQCCRLVGDAMGTGRAKVLEIEGDGKTLLVRAGVGWVPDIVGRTRIAMGKHSSERLSINERKPVISTDISQDERFEVPDFMKEAGVRAFANVPIFLPGGRAFGLLQVDASEPRDFDQDDIEFLRTYAIILGPIVDRILKFSALRSIEERFRLTVAEATDYAIFITDQDDVITDWLPGATQVFGWSAQEAIGQPASILFTPEDREAAIDVQEIAEAHKKGSAPDIRWHLRKDGSHVFIEGSVRALRDAKGHVNGYIKIGQDVTHRRESEERQKVLIAELHHRTRNLMTVVLAMSDMTARTSIGLDDFRARFQSRLEALARVQGLLSRLSDLNRVTFDELIQTELAAMGSDPERITLSGPSGIPLRSSTVQTLAMALHELATNAVKYGALGQAAGRLAITWSLEADGPGGKSWLHLDWRERGVEMQPAGAAPRGTGQGRELIERALPYQLKAKTTYTFTSDGVHCTISLPVSVKTRKQGKHG